MIIDDLNLLDWIFGVIFFIIVAYLFDNLYEGIAGLRKSWQNEKKIQNKNKTGLFDPEKYQNAKELMYRRPTHFDLSNELFIEGDKSMGKSTSLLQQMNKLNPRETVIEDVMRNRATLDQVKRLREMTLPTQIGFFYDFYDEIEQDVACCKKCGFKHEGEDVFCANCGEKL